MGKRRGSSGPLPLFSRCCPVPDQIYENPPAWVDRPPFCFSFFPECARSTVFFTNQYLLTYGFIFRFLIPLAEDFDTWTQEVSFTRIFCMRCIQDDPSVESYFSGLPCFCDLYEWSRLVPLTVVHESAVLAAQHPRLKNLVAWWLLDSRGVYGVLRTPRLAGASRRARSSSGLWKGRLPFCSSSLFVFASVPTLTSGPSYQQPLLLPFPPCMSLFSLLWNSSTCSPCLTGSLRNSVASLWTPVAALQPWTQLVVSSPQPWPVLGNATYPQRRSRASSTGVPWSTRQPSSSSRPSVALQEANQGRRQQRKSLHLARTV